MATNQADDKPVAGLEHQVTADSTAQGITADEEMTIAPQNYVPGSDEEKKLVRKIDFVLLPLLWWMYVLAYLDRGNVVSCLTPGWSFQIFC